MTERIAQVYLIRLGDTDYFKVGMTTDINGRMASLQTATPFDLHLIAASAHKNALAVERDMHDGLKDFHIRNEWFQCEQTEIVRIFEIISAMATIDQVLDDPALDQELREVEIFQLPPAEIEVLDKERKIAFMLKQKYSYRQIERELGVSHATIAVVSRLLRSGNNEMPILEPNGIFDENDAT